MTLNISSINDNIDEEFNFDNLAPLRTFEETLITDAVNTVINDGEIPTMNSVETTNYDREDMNLEQSRIAANKTINLSAKKNPGLLMLYTQRLDKTYFVCNCGYSSSNKSSTARHKCRNNESVIFKCPRCEKICKNPGSLTYHITQKYKLENKSPVPNEANPTIYPVLGGLKAQ